MSMNALAWAWKQKAGSPRSKLLLIYLADGVGEDNFYAFYEDSEYAKIAEFMETGEKEVMISLEELRELGLIKEADEDVGEYLRVI
jgi:pyocin large subunit-like protein